MNSEELKKAILKEIKEKFNGNSPLNNGQTSQGSPYVCTNPAKNMTEEELKKAEREVCFNCKHTKRWHKKGCCSQPTCMCNCFIESGLNYTTDVLNAFQAGQLAEREKCLKIIEELYEKELKEYRVESDGTLTEESGIALGSMMCFKDKLKVELTKKVSEEK